MQKNVTVIMSLEQMSIDQKSLWLVLQQQMYKKRLVSRINPNSLPKINLQNTWTLQLNDMNQIKSKWNYLQKLIKGTA